MNSTQKLITPELSEMFNEIELDHTEQEIWSAIKDLMDCQQSFIKPSGTPSKPRYLTVINNASITQRQGIITLIPKPAKDPHILANWRPISLLNADYKILTKALATRLKKILPEIIKDQQTGFIPGRQIDENILKIECIKNQLLKD